MDEQNGGGTQAPKWYITLGVLEDGNFACDGNCLNDEMIARAILHKGSAELDRWFQKQAREKAARAQGIISPYKNSRGRPL